MQYAPKRKTYANFELPIAILRTALLVSDVLKRAPAKPATIFPYQASTIHPECAIFDI